MKEKSKALVKEWEDRADELREVKNELFVRMRDGNVYKYCWHEMAQTQFIGMTTEEFEQESARTLLNSFFSAIKNGFIRFDKDIYAKDQVVKAYTVLKDLRGL